MTNGQTSGNMSLAQGIGDQNQATTNGLFTLGERWSFCPRDGGKIEADWHFCPKCGMTVGWVGVLNGLIPQFIGATGQSGQGSTAAAQTVAHISDATRAAMGDIATIRGNVVTFTGFDHLGASGQSS